MSERKVILNHSSEFETLDKIREYFLKTNIIGDTVISISGNTEGLYAYKGNGEIIHFGANGPQGERGEQGEKGNDGTGVYIKPDSGSCVASGDA